MKHYITLRDLIEELQLMPQDGVVPFGFGAPASYRGYYEQLAFEPLENAKIADMLAYAESAVGATFEGYKGGDFTMDDESDCWIASYGASGGTKIGWTLIGMWRAYLNLERGAG